MAIVDSPASQGASAPAGGLQRRALGVPDLVFFIVAASARASRSCSSRWRSSSACSPSAMRP
jgi:hypothetical protein